VSGKRRVQGSLREEKTPSRVAIVTGANRGIGLETCRRLAELGYRVLLASRDAAKGEAAARPLAARGLNVVAHRLDVNDMKDVAALAAYADLELGGADVLINNAAILLDEDRDVLDTDIDDFRGSMETNVYGPLRLCQALVPGMRSRGYGRVVNVSSGAGRIASMTGYAPPYSMSKSALNAITRLVAHAARGGDVLVNAVDPGWVRTGMGGPEAPRSAEDGADTIVWCATLPKGGPTGELFHDRRQVPW
jgi:NAD(P)-dependent dehydrogenase (short-subunit alcohol dehydrogenase family)